MERYRQTEADRNIQTKRRRAFVADASKLYLRQRPSIQLTLQKVAKKDVDVDGTSKEHGSQHLLQQPLKPRRLRLDQLGELLHVSSRQSTRLISYEMLRSLMEDLG